MKKGDNRAIKVILGLLGTLGATVGKNPAIGIPIAVETTVISAMSVLLETFEIESRGETKVETKPEATQSKDITLKIPVGASIKIEN